MTPPDPLAAGALVACPFCGDQPAVMKHPANPGWFAVRCACRAQGPDRSTRDTTIAAWNSRAPSPPAAGARETAERIVDRVVSAYWCDPAKWNTETLPLIVSEVAALLPAHPAAGDAEAVAAEIENEALLCDDIDARDTFRALAARVRLLGRQGGNAELLREACMEAADLLDDGCSSGTAALIARLRAAAGGAA